MKFFLFNVDSVLYIMYELKVKLFNVFSLQIVQTDLKILIPSSSLLCLQWQPYACLVFRFCINVPTFFICFGLAKFTKTDIFPMLKSGVRVYVLTTFFKNWRKLVVVK